MECYDKGIEKFKEEYSLILQKKISDELSYYLECKNNNVNPFKYGTIDGRIEDMQSMLGKAKNMDNINFERMDFWGFSKSGDKEIVALITNYNFAKAWQFTSEETFKSDCKRFGYTKFIIENNTLIDFIRLEENTDDVIVCVVDEVDVNILKLYNDEHKRRRDELTRTPSNYVSQHTRNGANMSYWNIGGVRVYD